MPDDASCMAIPSNDRTLHGIKSAPGIDFGKQVCDHSLMRCEFPNCEEDSTEFIDISDDDGANVCRHHEEAYLDECEEDFTGPTPVRDWLRTYTPPFPG